MTEIIEPHPKLIEYLEIAYNILPEVNKDLNDFFEAGEWHYIQSDLESNIYLFKRLDEVGLLTNQINACDCGIGLGTIFFDLYLQSKEFPNNKFTFTGIERHDRYIDCLNNNLLKYWDSNLNLIHDDIMNINYSNYNFIYFYQPFKISDKAVAFYHKVISEAPEGAIIMGLNTFQVQAYGDEVLNNVFRKLRYHKIDDLHIFIK